MKKSKKIIKGKTLKLTLESPSGYKATRKLNALWSEDVVKDLKFFHNESVGMDFMSAMASVIQEAITREIILDMLKEFEKKARK